MAWSENENIASHLPHPPPPIGGALGPPPWFILPIRRLPPGGPGGLQQSEAKKHGVRTVDMDAIGLTI